MNLADISPRFQLRNIETERERKRVRDTLDVSLGTGWFHGAIDQSSRARGSIDRYHARDVCMYKTQPRIFKSPVPYKAFTARICLFEHRAIIAIPSRSYYAETRAFSIARGSRYRGARCVGCIMLLYNARKRVYIYVAVLQRNLTVQFTI